MMLKGTLSAFLLLLLLGESLGLDVNNYTALIEELNHDTRFIDEYTKWSARLGSQADYLYGDGRSQSPCSTESFTDDADDDGNDDDDDPPTSVHQLRPKDINCIAALGDSFTTGLNMHAMTPADLLLEHRGLSWSIGGDYTFSQMPTLPNILKQFNPELNGFSVKQHELSLSRQSLNDSRLNMAKSGFYINSLPYQAKMLLRLLKNETFCNWNNDWKLITIFLGINDLCMSCQNDLNDSTYNPEQYRNYLRDTLDLLYNATVPRLFINLVQPPDIRGYRDLSTKNYVCQTFLQELCPCASASDDAQLAALANRTAQYQKALTSFMQSNRYDQRDDFTVVLQPFMLNMPFPFRNRNGTIDTSYVAPDCFHFSGKAHAQVARSLWNNMLEPVGGKRATWSINRTLKCPTRKYPYLFTAQNSAKALADLTRSSSLKPLLNLTTATFPSTRVTPVASITINSTAAIDSDSTAENELTSTTIIARSFNVTIARRAKTSPVWSRIKLFLLLCFLSLLLLLVFLNFRRRRHHRLHLPQTDSSNFHRFDGESDSSDMEVYTQPNPDAKFQDDKQMTSTHGTRMSLE